MDKSNGRISIKINGQERNLDEKDKESVESKVSHNSESNLENDLNDQNDEVAVSKEPDEEFTWVLPNNDEEIQEPIKVSPIEDVRNTAHSSSFIKSVRSKSYRNGNNTSFKPFLISILLAIIVGSGFGIIMLKVFPEAEAQPTATEPTTSVTSPITEDNEGKTDSTSVSIELGTINAAVVQEGMYSSQDSAKTAVEAAKNSGSPAAAVGIDDSFYVFVGIGLEKENLANIATIFTEKQNKEPYSKPIELAGGDFSNLSEHDASFINDAQKLFSELIGQSSNAFQAKTISTEKWAVITELHQKLKSSEGLDDHLKSFSEQITNAFNQLNTYQLNKSEAELLKSQQSLLDAMHYYQAWKNSLS
jgi:stage II sporulation protein B